jgi:predicted HAD superfamily Cof-like phosphohydrolase
MTEVLTRADVKTLDVDILDPGDADEAALIIEKYEEQVPYGFRSPFELVQSFHRKFGIPCYSAPAMLQGDAADFRVRFMQEELDEYKKAVAEGDLEGAYDALIDLVYVALGTADMHGFRNFDAAFFLVHQANMRKQRVRKASESKRGSTYDVVKPHGWKPPLIRVAIEKLVGLWR